MGLINSTKQKLSYTYQPIAWAGKKAKDLGKWQNSPTDLKPLLSNPLDNVGPAFAVGGKFLMRTITSMAKNPIVIAGASTLPTLIGPLANTSPSVRAAVAATTMATLWYFKKNHDVGAKEAADQKAADQARKIQAEELALNTSLIRSFGGEASIGLARTKPMELATGLFQFSEENFPADKAIVRVDNSKKATVYGLRIVDKVTKDVYYATVSYAGGKLQIFAPEMPTTITAWTIDQIANKRHNRYELVAPQGKELTLLQERVNRMEPKVQEHDRAIMKLEQSNAELQAKVETLEDLLGRLVRAIKAQNGRLPLDETAPKAARNVVLEARKKEKEPLTHNLGINTVQGTVS